MDDIKEAFSRVKGDMDLLRYEIELIKENLLDAKEGLIEMKNIFRDFVEKTHTKQEEKVPTYEDSNSTVPIHTSTDNSSLRALKDQNLGISTGNHGAPTDRQTDKQTNRHMDKSSDNLFKINENPKESFTEEKVNSINNAIEILDSLDNLKKEIRLKFKRLTEQEMIVFTMLYQLSEEKGFSDYKTIAKKLNLTESSIRDYIGRLIKKGIPVEKTKINNKTIQLNISPNLKKIATLPTILQLRGI